MLAFWKDSIVEYLAYLEVCRIHNSPTLLVKHLIEVFKTVELISMVSHHQQSTETRPHGGPGLIS